MIGEIGGIIGCVWTLFCWQMEQPATKLLTYTERPGHQKSHSTTALVQKCSRWLRRGDEWIE